MFHRHDSFTLKDYKVTVNGFLDISGIVTRNGIFKYDDGNELRPPEEVFNEKSLKTMFAIPVTWEHPQELLREETISLYQKGIVASKPTIEKLDDNISVVKLDSIIVQDKALIHEIVENGLREFSLGYTCDLENVSGKFDSQDYVRVQKNIVYNHLAIVKDARCGKVCSIVPKLDSQCQCKGERTDMKKDEDKPSDKSADEPKSKDESKDSKKDEDEDDMPEWAKKMCEQNEKIITLLDSMSSKKSEGDDEPKDKDLYDDEEKGKDKKDKKRKDSISNFNFNTDDNTKKDSQGFEVYTRESFLKSINKK